MSALFCAVTKPSLLISPRQQKTFSAASAKKIQENFANIFQKFRKHLSKKFTNIFRKIPAPPFGFGKSSFREHDNLKQTRDMTIRPKTSGKFNMGISDPYGNEITIEIEKIKFCMKCYRCVIKVPVTSANIDGGRTIAFTDLTLGCDCGDGEHTITKEGFEALELLKNMRFEN